MKIQLYVYDLSRGLARGMSMQFLGIQIDAVYHTSLVFDNIEYFFGAGVQTCRPGASHHGQPMEVHELGDTELPLEVILEYLESLKQVYTPESYDLFAHNCNNFTNDFSQFLVGRGIPEHITSLPSQVLNTPFGQMLKPQIDQAMRPITQAQVPPAPPRAVGPPVQPRYAQLRLPIFSKQSKSPVIFSKVPPLDKLEAKIRGSGPVDATFSNTLTETLRFVKTRHREQSKDAPLPDLAAVGSLIDRCLTDVPLQAQFAVVDLWRMVVVDPRASSYYVQNSRSTRNLIEHVHSTKDCPYSLRLTALQWACNLFGSTIPLDANLKESLAELVTECLLDKEHATLRVAASSLAYNLATAQAQKTELPQARQVELAASLIESLNAEDESGDAVRTLAMALARLVFTAPQDSDIVDLCQVMEASQAVSGKSALVRAEDRPLLAEIGQIVSV